MLLMVSLLVTMSASAAARRYAKISRAWVEHDVILDGQRGMKVHLYLTVSGMKRRSVSLTGEVTLDSDVAGDDPEVIYRCDGALMPSHDIDTYQDYTLFVNYDTGSWPEGDHHYYLNVLVTNTANGEALNTPGSTILDFSMKRGDDGSYISYDATVEEIKQRIGYQPSTPTTPATTVPVAPPKPAPQAAPAPVATPKPVQKTTPLTPSAQEMTDQQRLYISWKKDRIIKQLDAGDGNYIVICTSSIADGPNKVTDIFWVPRDFRPYSSAYKQLMATDKNIKCFVNGIYVLKLINHTLDDGREFSTVYICDRDQLANGEAWEYKNKNHPELPTHYYMEEHRISSKAAAWLQLLIEGKLTTMSFQGRYGLKMETTTRVTLKAPRRIPYGNSPDKY